MRHLRINFLLSIFVFCISAFSFDANATLLINPPKPYPQLLLGDSTASVITYAANSGAYPGSAVVDVASHYRSIDVLNPYTAGSLIWIDVLSNNSNMTSVNGQPIVVTLSIDTSTSGTEIPLQGAGVVSGDYDAPPACGGAGTCYGNNNKSAYYSVGRVVRIAFSLADLCSSTTGAAGSICTSPGYSAMSSSTPTTLSQNIHVTISSADPQTGIGILSGTGVLDQGSFTLQLTNVSPVLGSCPNSAEQDYYFPGDGQIYLKASNFAPSASTNGVALQSLLLMAKPGASVDPLPGGTASNPIVDRLSLSGEPTATGFDNNQSYSTVVFAENAAGIIGDGSSGTGCQLTNVQSRTIRGVLNESKCFIATATYHDGRAAPVMMLRRFRDRILSHFELGREFIHAYYTYSPALAEWAWDKPIIRSIALRALTPVEVLAWAWLKLAHAQTPTASPEGPKSIQPYIDRLKKQLNEEDQRNGNDFPESNVGYTEQEKRKLNPTPTPAGVQPYIDRLKKSLPAEDSSEGYSEKQKELLPPEKDQESPIEAVKSGHDHPPGMPEAKPIENAFSFKLGISPNIDVGDANGYHSFSEVYGSSWQPDLIFHFEHQFVHSENFGSLAASIDLGVSYAAANGLMDQPFPSSSSNYRSITNFTFLQIPVILGAYYRLNLARVIRPYVGAGIGSMFYTEIRDDDRKDLRGYSFVYTTSVGASLLLDFLDRATARDSFFSIGIQHTYFFLEYLYLNTFQTDVMFQRSGPYAGFLFEF